MAGFGIGRRWMGRSPIEGVVRHAAGVGARPDLGSLSFNFNFKLQEGFHGQGLHC